MNAYSFTRSLDGVPDTDDICTNATSLCCGAYFILGLNDYAGHELCRRAESRYLHVSRLYPCCRRKKLFNLRSRGACVLIREKELRIILKCSEQCYVNTSKR